MHFCQEQGRILNERRVVLKYFVVAVIIFVMLLDAFVFYCLIRAGAAEDRWMERNGDIKNRKGNTDIESKQKCLMEKIREQDSCFVCACLFSFYADLTDFCRNRYKLDFLHPL